MRRGRASAPARLYGATSLADSARTVQSRAHVWLDDVMRGQPARAAALLLQDAAVAQSVDSLPFAAGDVVVGLGDSITASTRSWLELLRCLLAARRPLDKIQIVNAGVSGDTTVHIASRFAAATALGPAWIICLMGTNDARRHGAAATKQLVAPAETARNAASLRRIASLDTGARWLWLTPPPVVDAARARRPLPTHAVHFRPEDAAAAADAIRSQPGPVLDLDLVFGRPPAPDLYEDDGVHPNLLGQMRIVRALVARLAEERAAPPT